MVKSQELGYSYLAELRKYTEKIVICSSSIRMRAKQGHRIFETQSFAFA